MATVDDARGLLTAYLAHEREALTFQEGRAHEGRVQQESARAEAAAIQERIESYELALERLA